MARWYPRDGDSQGTVLPRGWGYPEDGVPRGWNLSLHSRAGGAERQPGCWWVSCTHSPVVPVAPLVPMVPWSLCCIWFPQPCGPPGPTVPTALPVPAAPRAPQPHGWWQLGRQRGRGRSRGGGTPGPAPACTVHFILSKHGVSAAAPPQRRLPAIRPGLSLSPRPAGLGHLSTALCPQIPPPAALQHHPFLGETEAGLGFTAPPLGRARAPLPPVACSPAPAMSL